MLNKTHIKQAAIESIESKLSDLQEQLDELQQGLGSNSKSTAGDKHETGRAMLHLEQERLGKQIEPLIKMRAALKQIDCSEADFTVKQGSLVTTKNGTYFLSVSIGPVSIGDKTVFCLSPVSPLGKMLIGLKQGESFEHLGKVDSITELR